MLIPQQARFSRGGARRMVLWLALASVFTAPLIAMQFTKEVAWGPYDFLAAAALLGGVVLLTEGAIRFIRSTGLRLTVILFVVVGALLVWAQGAVGLLD